MALNTNVALGSMRGAVKGFTPVEAPADSVQVIVLQRKRTGDDNESDPRQRQPGRNGTNASVIRNQVLLDLVGVIVDGVCYPDYTGKNKLPEFGSQEYIDLVSRPCGIKVEAMYAGGIAKLRKAIIDKVPGLPFTLEQLDKAEATNTLNQLLTTSGAALRALGLMEVQEWTIGDILFGSKTLSVQLLGDGEGDAYAEGFSKLRGKFGFPNVAFVASMGRTLQATELTTNGIITPTYTPDGLFFEWVKVPGAQGRVSYELDAEFAISGAKFAMGSTTAASASELARRSMSSQHEGAAQSTDFRSKTRIAGRNAQLLNAMNAGQRAPEGVVAGIEDL